ncbi:MAG: hypothetical protein PHF31_05000 [Methylobacter sp.]|nr:hypothetical protein [Methylobacter sp.]
MKKIILISAATLFSTGVYADPHSHHAIGCGDSSLKGKYGYEVSGVNTFPVPVLGAVTRSSHVVGQANFNGNGEFTIAGYGSAAGYTADRIGHGTYAVDPATCTAKGTLVWDVPVGAPFGTPAENSEFYIVLDQMDNSDGHSDQHSANNIAHHASVLVSSDGLTADSKVSFPSSASGSLTKFVGKFH